MEVFHLTTINGSFVTPSFNSAIILSEKLLFNLLNELHIAIAVKIPQKLPIEVYLLAGLFDFVSIGFSFII